MRTPFASIALAACLIGPCIPIASAQWQLPPGTSSSAGDGRTHTAANRTAEDLAAAERLMQAQDWKGAVTALQPLCVASPKNVHALYDLGFSQESLHDDAAAKAAYQQAIAADPSAVEPLTALGLMLAREGDALGSQKLLRQAVGVPGTTENAAAQAQANRALARLDLESAPDRSREELIAAIRLSSETPDDMLLGAEIAEALHDFPTAEQAYRRALTANPTSTETLVRYARLLVQKEKFEDASRLLESALTADPDNAELLAENAGLMVREKKFADALPILQRLHAKEPTNAAVTRLLARTDVASNKPGDADALFQQLHHDDPSNGDITAEWADSLIREKRNADAEAILLPALAGHFSSPHNRSHAAEELAFAASANHHPETVIRAIAIRNENLPMDAPSAFLLAAAHDTLHHTSQAAGAYRQFLELAQKKYPDEEWQAQQRLVTLSRAK